MKNVKNLVAKVGFQFDEAVELFSAETLETMALSHVVGGATPQNGCSNHYYTQCVDSCGNSTTPSAGPTPAASSSGDGGGTTPPCNCGCIK